MNKVINSCSSILVLILSLLYFYYLATNRLIAQDEGFYLYAGKLVAQGQLPYIDFFYPQAPLLPYIFGLWGKIFGFTWEVQRLLMAISSSLIAYLVFLETKSKQNIYLGLLSVIFFSASIMVFPWYPIAKGYTFSTLFILLSYYFLTRNKNYFASGALVALAGLIRLPLAGTAPIIIIWLYFNLAKDPIRFKKIMHFMIGGIVVCLPVLLLAGLNLESFYYNNLGYHLARPELESKRWQVAEILFGLRSGQRSILTQVPIFLYSTILFVIIRLKNVKLPSLASVLALSLLLINLQPQVVYIQYFSVMMPFLIISTLEFWYELYQKISSKINSLKIFKFITAFTLICLVFIYTHRTPKDLIRYLHNGNGVIGIGNYQIAKNWKIKNVEKLSTLIEKHSQANDIIFTDWSGYLLESNRAVLPGLENHFALDVAFARKLPKEKLNQYKILSVKELDQTIKDRVPSLVVTYLGRHLDSRWKKLALANGYKEVERLNSVVVLGR